MRSFIAVCHTFTALEEQRESNRFLGSQGSKDPQSVDPFQAGSTTGAVTPSKMAEKDIENGESRFENQ